MIILKNGHSFDFVCASGALAWYGEGWWWEYPLRYLGVIDPTQFTIITKTLTYYPRIGNLKMWCPWRCVRLIKGGVVNAVGLTNPGLEWWFQHIPEPVWQGKWKVIISIMPTTQREAQQMASMLNGAPIVGIELNLSCPNIEHNSDLAYMIYLVQSVKRETKHPIILKLGPADSYLKLCDLLWDTIDAVDLINTVPWHLIHARKPSPLAKYGLEGGVSGMPIRDTARRILEEVKALNLNIPIIAGGGIYSVEEALMRRSLGADAVSLGTIFMRNPWRARSIMWSCRRRIR